MTFKISKKMKNKNKNSKLINQKREKIKIKKQLLYVSCESNKFTFDF